MAKQLDRALHGTTEGLFGGREGRPKLIRTFCIRCPLKPAALITNKVAWPCWQHRGHREPQLQCWLEGPVKGRGRGRLLGSSESDDRACGRQALGSG